MMMNKELDRLKRIAKQFPEQEAIIKPQTQALTESRDRLAATLTDAAASIEKIYVTWLVDRTNGVSQINNQRGTLTRQLADAIREENNLVSRLRANPDTAT